MKSSEWWLNIYGGAIEGYMFFQYNQKLNVDFFGKNTDSIIASQKKHYNNLNCKKEKYECWIVCDLLRTQLVK